jgi:hypothetical protein
MHPRRAVIEYAVEDVAQLLVKPRRLEIRSGKAGIMATATNGLLLRQFQLLPPRPHLRNLRLVVAVVLTEYENVVRHTKSNGLVGGKRGITVHVGFDIDALRSVMMQPLQRFR